MAFLRNVKQPSKKDELVSSVDLGSSKIACVIARQGQSASELNQGVINFGVDLLKVVGVGQYQSKGIRGQHILNIDELEEAIINAVHQAEKMAKQNIASVYVSLPSEALKIRYVVEEILVHGQAIEDHHIQKGYNDQLKAGAGYQVIHVFPQGYQVDDCTGVKNPKGMIANVLRAHYLRVSAPINFLKNITLCFARCHLEIAGFVADSYAAGLSTLVEDEIELGALVVNMGGASTTLSLFYEGQLNYIRAVAMGGNHITHDIARGLGTPINQAERLKNLYGSLWPTNREDQEMVLVSQMGEHENMHTQPYQVSKGMITTIVKARVEEIFEHVMLRLKKDQINPLFWQRVIITGGGSQIQGMKELACRYFGHSQVRIAQPLNIAGGADYVTSPAFSVASGLLRFAYQEQQIKKSMANKNERTGRMRGTLKRIFGI